jgi:hypothetical protein
VAVIGNGNVALDVARVLAKSADEMVKSDIVPEAGAAIAAAPLTDIHVIGRRGPEQASFTNNELAEMGRLARAVALVDPAALNVEAPKGDPTPERLRKAKNLEILRGFANNKPGTKPIALHFVFNTPIKAIKPGEFDLVITCIGYTGEPYPAGEGVFRRRLGQARADRHHPDQSRREPRRGPASAGLAERPRSQERARSDPDRGRCRGLASHRQGRDRRRRQGGPPSRQVDGLEEALGGRARRLRALFLPPWGPHGDHESFMFGRRLACALVASFAFAASAGAETVLKVSLHSDLKIIDPIWTTALISTHHGNMVYDVLFALDDKIAIKPQMVDKWEISPDKLTWTFTLRDGLEWHDGKPVTADDCVASIKRWAAKDSMGQKLMASWPISSRPMPGPSRWC